MIKKPETLYLVKKYFDFKLKSNKDALFEFKTKSGDVIKFRYLTHGDEVKLREQMTADTVDVNKYDILRFCNRIREIMTEVTEITNEDKELISEDIEEIIAITGENFTEDFERTIPNFITSQMIMYTVSVNNNTDREFIRGFIENMRVGDALEYRRYYNDNRPRVDLSINVDIPESDGGGSFNTFLRIEDTLFINY